MGEKIMMRALKKLAMAGIAAIGTIMLGVLVTFLTGSGIIWWGVLGVIFMLSISLGGQSLTHSEE
jgi:hypothetical protein